MSRSGYTDDFDDENNALALYRQAVRQAIRGKRGQGLLVRLRDALDAMPSKRLIAGDIRDERGDVCAFGALDAAAPKYEHEYARPSHTDKLADHFGIARALAAEIVYMNDEAYAWLGDETPEQRWSRMRKWVDEQIFDESSGRSGAVDPHVVFRES